MDLRRSIRIPTGLKIIVYHNGHLALRCEATNISLNGMYLKTEAARFAKNTLLEIRFSLKVHSITEVIYVCARVTQSTYSGIGVKFVDDGGNTLIHLRKILKKLYFQPHLVTGIDKC